MRDGGSTLRKQTTMVRVTVSAYNFFFLNFFILTDTQLNYAVTHPLFNYTFQNHLCSIGGVRNASDADISVIFRGFCLFVCLFTDILI